MTPGRRPNQDSDLALSLVFAPVSEFRINEYRVKAGLYCLLRILDRGGLHVNRKGSQNLFKSLVPALD